jgi:hypothetical protein
MESTNQVLPRRHIDARLAPDGGIDHGNQTRRHLDYGDSAHIRRGTKTGEIPNYATSERNGPGVAPEPGSKPFVFDACLRFTIFATLPGVDDCDHGDASTESCPQAIEVCGTYIAVCDNRDTRGHRHEFRPQAIFGQKIAPNVHCARPRIGPAQRQLRLERHPPYLLERLEAVHRRPACPGLFA